MIQIGLLGAQGRMGEWVDQLILSEYASKAQVTARVSQGEDLTPLLNTQVVIDFSSPQAICALAELALQRKNKLPAFVIGSTGISAEQNRVFEKLSQLTLVLAATNFSTGVMALSEILKQASPMLKKLGYSPVIVETHHVHKKDAPSGTAISLKLAIAPQDPGMIPTHSVRGGEIIGDHEVTFYGKGDHLTLGHFAQDRSIFARGAIDVALWLGKKSGTGRLQIGDYFSDYIKEQYL